MFLLEEKDVPEYETMTKKDLRKKIIKSNVLAFSAGATIGAGVAISYKNKKGGERHE